MMEITTTDLGLQDYLHTWQAMQDFTETRTHETPDALWLVEHPPVFTQGYRGKAEHIHDPKSIPVVQTDRGGQVTYHGPGQLVVYTLIDLKRRQLTIRDLVCALEIAIIDTLKEKSVIAIGKREAPGVYVNDNKIASIGLRVKRGCSYHGLALNLQMDLSPFQQINPCGYHQLRMTQLSEFTPCTVDEIKPLLSRHLIETIGHKTHCAGLTSNTLTSD